jgi:hypothetical protein
VDFGVLLQDGAHAEPQRGTGALWRIRREELPGTDPVPPVALAPVALPPVTLAPVTPAPVTPAPVTPAPVTPALAEDIP